MNDRRYQFGVCLFDDPSRMESGWAAINGADAFRINGHADLIQHRNTAFITNSGWSEFNSTGLSSVSYLRRNNFFKTSLTELVGEFDLSLRDSPRNEVAKTVSEIIGFAVGYMQDIFPSMDISQQTLSDAAYALIPFREQYAPNNDTEELSKSAWQENSTIKSKWELGIINLSFNSNRVRHAEMVLSSPVPSGYAAIRNVTGEHMTVDEILGCELPVAIMADIEWKNSSDAELCAVGTGGMSYVPGKMREWYMLPEVMMLDPYARFNIHQVATWSGWAQTPIPAGLFGRDDLDKLSLALGLVAESYLAAMSSKKYKKVVKHFHPVAACWLRSIDRALSFAAAKRLQDDGMRIKNYSYGQVGCSALREDINKSLNIAAACGFYSSCIFARKDDE